MMKNIVDNSLTRTNCNTLQNYTFEFRNNKVYNQRKISKVSDKKQSNEGTLPKRGFRDFARSDTGAVPPIPYPWDDATDSSIVRPKLTSFVGSKDVIQTCGCW
jgi:hypothetical protein